MHVNEGSVFLAELSFTISKDSSHYFDEVRVFPKFTMYYLTIFTFFLRYLVVEKKNLLIYSN